VDLLRLSREAWDRQAADGGPWSTPVSTEQIDAARHGRWAIRLTPNKDVPADWYPAMHGLQLLCLAGAGGQQAPILAAAGARVTVLDNSPGQLDADRTVALRDGLEIDLQCGDMADLGRFDDDRFGLIVHPVSNCFVPSLNRVWQECYRVLAPGGRLLAGFLNPAFFLFDEDADRNRGVLKVANRLPYADIDVFEPAEVERRVAAGDAMTFSHSLEAQIGGQLQAGFLLAGMYEDDWSDEATTLNRFMPTGIATLAIKPVAG
jgi:SAM-dependent methyltransferase